jgi:ABC-type sugar transport system substrate-binding protein/AraC-like DNA-binding protein
MEKVTVLRVVVLAVLWLGLLSGCGSSEERTEFVIGFSQCTSGDNWRQLMQDEMHMELAKYPEIDLLIEDAESDSYQQIQQIKDLVARGIDLLIVSPNEAAPITPIIEEVYYDNIPVIIIDRRINSRLYTAYIGADNEEVGRVAGAYAANLLGGNGRILEIWGLRGSSPAISRHDGFRQSLEGFSELTVVGEVDGRWEKDVVEEVLTEDYLLEQDIDLIFAHNDRMALGAFLVAKEAGIDDELHIIGIDGLPGPNRGVQFVQDGILDATALYPTGGVEAIRTAVNILYDQEFSKENILSTIIIDSQNVDVIKSYSDRITALMNSYDEQLTTIREDRRKHQYEQFMYASLSALLGLLLLGISLLLFSSRDRNQTFRSRIASMEKQISSLATIGVAGKVPAELEADTEAPQPVAEDADAATEAGRTEKEEAFLRSFMDAIEVNLTNPEFGVKELCAELGMSRVQLYRRVKGILGKKVSDYLQQRRLQLSKELLREKEYSISETAFQAGFSSPSYFSTAFKGRYGITPSEFKQQMLNKNND